LLTYEWIYLPSTEVLGSIEVIHSQKKWPSLRRNVSPRNNTKHPKNTSPKSGPVYSGMSGPVYNLAGSYGLPKALATAIGDDNIFDGCAASSALMSLFNFSNSFFHIQLIRYLPCLISQFI